MMAREQRVELIPRNDANRAGVAAVLGERNYSLCWLRGSPDDFGGLLPLLPAAAPLLLWTHPIGAGDPQAVLAQARLYPEGAGALLADLYHRSESRGALGCATLLQALGDGESATESLRRARLELARQGELRDWAGWICVGDARTRVELRRPHWFQRLLRKSPTSSSQN